MTIWEAAPRKRTSLAIIPEVGTAMRDGSVAGDFWWPSLSSRVVLSKCPSKWGIVPSLLSCGYMVTGFVHKVMNKERCGFSFPEMLEDCSVALFTHWIDANDFNTWIQVKEHAQHQMLSVAGVEEMPRANDYLGLWIKLHHHVAVLDSFARI